MKKIFLKFNSQKTDYKAPIEYRDINCELHFIHLLLEPCKYADAEIEKDIDVYTNTIHIFAYEHIKKPAKLTFTSKAQEQAFTMAYNLYYEKRFKDMPQINMSLANYEKIVREWYEYKQQQVEYIIFTLDESGPLDVVNIIGKNELSSQDLIDMKYEHERCIQWQKARKLYLKDHSWIDDKWRSPADNEFEADYEPYYDRDAPFSTPKVYTKHEIGIELKDRVAQRQPVEIIGMWISRVWSYYPGELTDPFVMFLYALSEMQDYGPGQGLSYEKLDNIADAMIADEEVTLERFGYDAEHYRFKD